jgi:hypothetical protein
MIASGKRRADMSRPFVRSVLILNLDAGRQASAWCVPDVADLLRIGSHKPLKCVCVQMILPYLSSPLLASSCDT